MTIYLKEKDLPLFILRRKILLKMESFTKKKNTSDNSVKLIKNNNKDFIQKETYFNKLTLASKIKKKTTIKI